METVIGGMETGIEAVEGVEADGEEEEVVGEEADGVGIEVVEEEGLEETEVEEEVV